MTGIITRKGKRMDREVLAGNSNRDEERADQIATSPEAFMLRAVVRDVIFDPGVVSTEIQELFEENEILNPDELVSAPRNSVIAIIISGAAAHRDDTPALFYPMFSHTHEPIKPGEHVWVFYENPVRSKAQGYWVSRIVGPEDIDDPNFTHMDRRFIDQNTPKTVDRFEDSIKLISADAQARLKKVAGDGPRFPNGADTEEAFTLPDIDGYEKINQEAIANRVTTYEPVPRYNKRPADWAAEGSNNSLLVLGEDRTGASAKLEMDKVPMEKATPDDDKRGMAGMADLVVGRGLGDIRMFPAAGAAAELTQPRTIENARGEMENDKAPKDQKKNLNEGDPDFENDAARFYAAMDTDLDKNFGKPLPKLNGGVDPTVVDKGSVVVAKSTHARVIAREDGTIRIIKEGVEDDEGGKGRAVIIMEPDGTIMIDGPKIILGSGIEKGNGAGTQITLGRDAIEPIVLGAEMKTLLTAYTGEIKAAIMKWVTTVTVPIVAIADPPNAGALGNFGIPIPGLIALGVALKQANTALQTDTAAADSTLKGNVDKTLSKIGKTK